MQIAWVYALATVIQLATAETVCEVPSGKSDDTPAIVSAFQRCGQNGKIIFGLGTYRVNKVMKTTGLKNVKIELKGRLQECLHVTLSIS